MHQATQAGNHNLPFKQGFLTLKRSSGCVTQHKDLDQTLNLLYRAWEADERNLPPSPSLCPPGPSGARTAVRSAGEEVTHFIGVVFQEVVGANLQEHFSYLRCSLSGNQYADEGHIGHNLLVVGLQGDQAYPGVFSEH